MAIALSDREVTLLKRVSEGLLQPLRPDWLLTAPDLATDLQRLLSMDLIGTTWWNPRTGHYDMQHAPGVGRTWRACMSRNSSVAIRSTALASAPRSDADLFKSSIAPSSSARDTSMNSCGSTRRLTASIYTSMTRNKCRRLSLLARSGRRSVGSREVALLTLLQPVLLCETRELYNRTSKAARHGFPH